jgi:hypothetical protein
VTDEDAKLEAMQAMSALPEISPQVLLTKRESQLLIAGDQIASEPPDRNDFLHTVMCQVGLPRRATEARTFERHSGHVSVSLEAGRLFNGREFVDQPLPFGTTPRLVMVHVSSEAVRTQSRKVEVGDSMRQFLQMLGMGDGGGPRGAYTQVRRQIEALAACRLTIGMQSEGRVVTVDSKPFKRFEAWLHQDGSQRTLWPGVMELSADFYDTLAEHAVPLDHRALSALKHSALSLDVYTWLAHRLCRINKPGGVMLSWQNLRDQFGQEYAESRDFKWEFRRALRQVQVVYPTARVAEIAGGLQLYPSPAPIQRTLVRGAEASSTVDNSTETGEDVR